jgi:hypothetical protein
MQAKWEEMFGEKEEEVVEEVKVKKPRKKVLTKKVEPKTKKTSPKKKAIAENVDKTGSPAPDKKRTAKLK